MEKIDKLRKILHTNLEKYPKIQEGDYKIYNKISYSISDKDYDYIKYFVKNFNKLNKTDQDNVLNKPKSDLYKIYTISKDNKSYVGSTSTSLLYFYRFNMFLLFSKQQSVFDLIKTKDPRGVEIKLLEVVRPTKNTRKLVKDRKDLYLENSSPKTHIQGNTTIVDAYMSIYNSILCRPIGEKKLRYVYLVRQKNKSYIFFINKKVDINKIEQKLRDKLRLTKDKIELELIEKIIIKNSLEEDIMKDRYRIIYKPTLNKKFCLPELEQITNLNSNENIEYLKKCVFLRTNELAMMTRYKKHLDIKDFVYLLRNKNNNRGAIKHHKQSLKEFIENMYDKSLRGKKDTLSKDLSIYPEKEFKIKILRELKEDDNPKTVVSRFENKFNISGYSLNLRQIYSIINSKK